MKNFVGHFPKLDHHLLTWLASPPENLRCSPNRLRVLTGRMLSHYQSVWTELGWWDEQMKPIFTQAHLKQWILSVWSLTAHVVQPATEESIHFNSMEFIKGFWIRITFWDHLIRKTIGKYSYKCCVFFYMITKGDFNTKCRFKIQTVLCFPASTQRSRVGGCMPPPLKGVKVK